MWCLVISHQFLVSVHTVCPQMEKGLGEQQCPRTMSGRPLSGEGCCSFVLWCKCVAHKLLFNTVKIGHRLINTDKKNPVYSFYKHQTSAVVKFILVFTINNDLREGELCFVKISHKQWKLPLPASVLFESVHAFMYKRGSRDMAYFLETYLVESSCLFMRNSLLPVITPLPLGDATF